MIPKAGNNLVFTMGNAGAQTGATDLTQASGRTVTVNYMPPSALDDTGALEDALLQQAIQQKVNGILISCINDSALSPDINKAVAAGIPVLTFDSDCPSSNRGGFYSLNSQPAGSTAADLLAASLGSGPQTVVIVTGQPAPNLDDRVTGFMNRLSSTYPNISVVATEHCNEDPTCGQVVEGVVQQYPTLNGLFLVGLWDLLAACSPDGSTCTDDLMPNWKKAAKAGLKSIAFDTLPFELTLMQQGYVSALLGQKYFGWGYTTTSLLFDEITANRQVSGFIDSGFDIVCPNNVTSMQQKWTASDFTQALSPVCNVIPASLIPPQPTN
jgi:ribose transport system substrate-binding protein